jgi:hypothetical protein
MESESNLCDERRRDRKLKTALRAIAIRSWLAKPSAAIPPRAPIRDRRGETMDKPGRNRRLRESTRSIDLRQAQIARMADPAHSWSPKR